MINHRHGFYTGKRILLKRKRFRIGMRILFLFLDGIGLGGNDPDINPFARARMPFLQRVLNGQRLTRESAPLEGELVTLMALDPNLGVEGLPQSATGQAVLLTGINLPAALGYHYGPKPNPAVAGYLNGKTIFSRAVQAGKKAALVSAYPPQYFEGIHSGKHMYSAIPLAVTQAGLPLLTREDYAGGRALAADFTGQGWRDMLGLQDAPVYTAREAGEKLAGIAAELDFSLFEYWASDYAGHRQDMDWAVRQLEVLDSVLESLVEHWNMEDGLIVLTSDHGNMEDLSTRRHTDAHVPLLLFGSKTARQQFQAGMVDLTGIAPAIGGLLGLKG